MAITPLEIRKQEFRKSLRGYEVHEVRSFLEMVSTEIESLLRDNASLNDRVKDMDAKIEDYRRMEQILQDTLTTTQKAADDLKSGARKEAETIMANARVEAQRFLKEAQTELARIKEETKMIEHQKLMLVSEFRGLLESYLRLLERLEKK
ncbi:MAG: DivIVA domain-containing protein [candidate division WOR-3 bacterium]|nr:MAG: DivIVA domain-containing protein [candidate division WOR-3 bacterium]